MSSVDPRASAQLRHPSSSIAQAMPATTEGEFVCGYCSSSKALDSYSCSDTRGSIWRWTRCAACGAISLTPRPTPAQLAAAYDASYYGASDSKFEGPVERFIERCRRGRARRLARGLSTGARVLDIGCGNGGFLAALDSCGSFSLYGTELAGGSAQRAARHPNIQLKVGVLDAGDFQNESLDLVTLFHVFEHLTDPRSTLDLIHRALKPGGRLVMSFPNIGSVQARLFRGRWLHLDPPRHLFLFPSRAFARAMDNAGFTIERRRFFSVEQNPFGFIQSSLNLLLGPRDVLYERLKGNTSYAPSHGSGSVFLQKAFAGLCLGPAIVLDLIESTLCLGATVEYTLRKRTAA